MGKALVTGATGFIGPHLVRILQRQGDEVICLRRQRSDVSRLEPLGVKFAIGDVTDKESLAAAVAGVDVVYHLAGRTAGFNMRQYLDVNEGGTRNLLEACAAQSNPPVVIHVSSLAAGGVSPRTRLRVESDPPEPVSMYGRSKLASEAAARMFAGQVPISIVRPPVVLGEGDRASLPLFRSIWRTRLHAVPGLSRPRYSIIHATDLAEMLAATAARGQRLNPAADDATFYDGVYYVAADEHVTWGELGRMIGEALGRKPLVLPMPLAIVRGAALGAEGVARLRRKPMVFCWDKVREAAAGSWTCSPEKAQRELGWKVGADLLSRLAQTAAWYREQKWL
mgnify:CR=1 FL=1